MRPRSLEIPEKMMALVNLAPSTEVLQIYEADLKVDGAFDEVIHGSSIVFHLASPASFDASHQVTSRDSQHNVLCCVRLTKRRDV